jgi:hypothetical protein
VSLRGAHARRTRRAAPALTVAGRQSAAAVAEHVVALNHPGSSQEVRGQAQRWLAAFADKVGGDEGGVCCLLV